MARIGKRTSSKKYAEVRKLQARVNKMLYKSTHIEKSNGKRQQVLAMKRQFYKSRSIKNPSHLSFRDLSPKDIKAYMQLLESIENNTFINPEKYAKYQEKMREKFESYGYDFTYDEIEDVLNDDVIDDLIKDGMSPSDFWAVYDDYTKGNTDDERVDEFLKMALQFKRDYDNKSVTLDDFYVYADAFFSAQTGESNDKVLYT